MKAWMQLFNYFRSPFLLEKIDSFPIGPSVRQSVGCLFQSPIGALVKILACTQSSKNMRVETLQINYHDFFDSNSFVQTPVS